MILESLLLMTSYLFVGCGEKTEAEPVSNSDIELNKLRGDQEALEDEEEMNMKSYDSEDINSQDKLDKTFSESKNKCIIMNGFLIFPSQELKYIEKNYNIKYLGNQQRKICKK